MAWQSELKQDYRALSDAYEELQQRHDHALESLAGLAQGIGIKPPWYTVNDGWESAMKHKASSDLLRISKMPFRKKPRSAYA